MSNSTLAKDFFCLTYDILVEPPTAKVRVKSVVHVGSRFWRVQSSLASIYGISMYIHCNVIYTNWLVFS